jgi:molecular chaperone HtpG
LENREILRTISKIVLEYGMLSEDKFYEKSAAFVLYPTVDDKFYTLEELRKS